MTDHNQTPEQIARDTIDEMKLKRSVINDNQFYK